MDGALHTSPSFVNATSQISVGSTELWGWAEAIRPLRPDTHTLPTLAPVTAAAARNSSAFICCAEKKLMHAPMVGGEQVPLHFFTFWDGETGVCNRVTYI